MSVEPWLLILVVIPVAILVALAMWLAQRRRDRRPDADADQLIRAGRTRDARGRVVKLIDPLPLHTLGRHDVIDREALDAIVEELEPGAGRKRNLLFIGLAFGVLCLIGLGVLLSMEGRPAWDDLVSTLLNPAIMAAVVGGVVAPVVAARQERMRRVCRVMLRHQRCPHCGYGLTGVPAHDDGTTVCPECACAWRIASDADGPVPAAPARRPTAVMWLIAALGAALAGGLVLFMLMR